MLIVNSIGPGVVRYFTDGRSAGRWSPATARLLGMSGPVDACDLRRLLQGRDPATNRDLKDSDPRRRRGGWDLIFGAPKSVSLLAASSEGEAARSVEGAHAAAVDGVMRQVEQRLRLQRCSADGTPLVAEGLLGASFDHTVNAAGEPHLHTHVLVANLSCSQGAWGAVINSEWYVGRPGLAALYQLELRARMAERGWNLDWRLRPDGLADLADVPRAAIRAASTQSRLAVSSGRYAARAGAVPQPWSGRVAAATGSDRVAVGAGEAGALPVTAPPTASLLEEPELHRAVSVRLTARRSDFRKWDVVVALAACHPPGATAEDAIAWADRFCAASRAVPSPTAGHRWATEAARRADDELARTLLAMQTSAGDPADLSQVEQFTRQTALSDENARHVAALTASESAIHFLGAEPGRTALLSQAEILDTCRQVWESTGRTVSVWTPTAEGAARWAVLAGLPAYRRGQRPDVLVVDRADRHTTADLSRLLAGSPTRVVFVEGGTMPRLTNPASHGLVEAGDAIGRHVCGPHEIWTAGTTVMTAATPEFLARGLPGQTGRAAAAALLEAWSRDREPSLMVGLGPEETWALNRAALGLLAGPERSGRKRDGEEGPGSFVPGDRVVVVKGRPGLPVYGTFGTVVEGAEEGADQSAGARGGHGSRGIPLRVAWTGGEVSEIADRRTLSGVGFGYAVTPHLAGRTSARLMVLGPASAMGKSRERVVREVPLHQPARGRGLVRGG